MFIMQVLCLRSWRDCTSYTKLCSVFGFRGQSLRSHFGEDTLPFPPNFTEKSSCAWRGNSCKPLEMVSLSRDTTVCWFWGAANAMCCTSELQLPLPWGHHHVHKKKQHGVTQEEKNEGKKPFYIYIRGLSVTWCHTATTVLSAE